MNQESEAISAQFRVASRPDVVMQRAQKALKHGLLVQDGLPRRRRRKPVEQVLKEAEGQDLAAAGGVALGAEAFFHQVDDWSEPGKRNKVWALRKKSQT